MGLWTLDDIPWDRFDPARVDPDILKVVKAAAMVEHNGLEYGRYLALVFADDPDFREAAGQWAIEEVQHGKALARWAGMADPDFDFEPRFARFAERIRLPDADESVRGSRTGELIARCMVEVGTSSYYSAMGTATDEPVLKEICRRIATDELRHYKLFYTHMKRYMDMERPGFFRRLWVGAGRIFESEDDELAYAFYIANSAPGEPYERSRYSRAYARRAYSFFKPSHVERGIAMVLKAIGIKPYDWLTERIARIAYSFMRFRSERLARAGV